MIIQMYNPQGKAKLFTHAETIEDEDGKLQRELIKQISLNHPDVVVCGENVGADTDAENAIATLHGHGDVMEIRDATELDDELTEQQREVLDMIDNIASDVFVILHFASRFEAKSFIENESFMNGPYVFLNGEEIDLL